MTETRPDPATTANHEAAQTHSGFHRPADEGGPSIGGLLTVRYFAAARAAAGTAEEKLTVERPISLDHLAARMADLHGPGLARVLRAASFLIDATAGARDRTVQAGSVVDVLPPFAGG